MSNASLIRRLTRKVVTLPAATAAAHAAGELPPDQDITVTIRKVQVGEVTSLVGVPPRLLALASDRKEGESKEDQRARVTRALQDDPTIVDSTLKLQTETTRAIVKLGVVDLDVVMEHDGSNPDALTPDEFGDDMGYLHDQIITFSSLPYAKLQEDAEAATTFPAEPVADRDQPNGETLRDPPERPVE